MSFLRGILYKNNYLYNLLDYLKNGRKKNLRFKIIKELINKNSTLIDFCGADGRLKEYLYESVKYTVADASFEFGKVCKRKKIKFLKLNCKDFNLPKEKFDYSVIIISLYQFRDNLQKIIKNLKKISNKKVIIIEEILPPNETIKLSKLKKLIRGYLCKTKFYTENNDLFSLHEFKNIMKKNNFRVINNFKKDNLLIGVYKI